MAVSIEETKSNSIAIDKLIFIHQAKTRSKISDERAEDIMKELKLQFSEGTKKDLQGLGQVEGIIYEMIQH